MQELFNNTDDALFELADRSQSDQHQELYFDSMRIVRLHRKTIAKDYIEAFYASFDATFADEYSEGLPAKASSQNPNRPGVVEDEEQDEAFGDYTLLDQDELEMNVAVSGIVSKVTSEYSLAVMHLTKRFDHLTRQTTVTERSNPLAPFVLSTNFSKALDVLDVHIKIRIILMKLFERFVMSRLGSIYEAANKALIDAGVLPELNAKIARSAPRAPVTHQHGASNLPDIGGSSGTPATGGSPSSAGVGGQYSGGGGLGGQHDNASGLGNSAAAVAPGNVDGSVSQNHIGPNETVGNAGFGSQQAQGPGIGSIDTPTDHAGIPISELLRGRLDFGIVQSLFENIRQHAPDSNHGLGLSAEQSNSGNGEQVSGPAVQLQTADVLQALSRLQSRDRQHATDVSRLPQLADLRELVIASQGNSTSPTKIGQADDDAVNFVGMLFDYILNDKNLAIPMKALIGRLQIPIVKLAIIDKTFFEKSAHPARTLLNELSSAGIGWSSAEELKRDALYDKIESIILCVLNEFSDDASLFAELLADFRGYMGSDSKRSILVEQRVRESEEGKAKTKTAKLKVQTLINQKASGLRIPVEAGKFISRTWSRVLTLRHVKGGDLSDEWRTGVATLDGLLWSLQPLSNLDDIAHRDQSAPQLVADILVGMDETGASADESTQFTAWLASQLEYLSASDTKYLEQDEIPEEIADAKELDEIILTQDVNPETPTDLEPEFLAGLKEVNEGAWVEFVNEDDSPSRCKLATITQPGNNYIFVNRRGMKVAEKNRVELAILLKEGRLRLIDESQIFDRALQSVIGNLRNMQRAQAERS